MSMRIRRVVTTALLLSAAACSGDKAGDQSGQSASNSSQSAGSTALGSTWADAGKMPDLFSGMWMSFSSFVEDDPKRNVPFTEQAQKHVDGYVHKRDIPYAQDGCQSPGLPIAMRTGPIKFTYAPGLISVYMQAVGHTRFIKMNQEQGKTTPRYYGNSVARWEGDTLVVETVDFLNEVTFQYGVGKPLPPEDTVGTATSDVGDFFGGAPPGAPSGSPPGAPPGTPPGGATPLGAPAALQASLSAAIWGPHGEGMRMVERMRLVDKDTLEINLTIHDDTVWSQPYVTATRNFKRIQKGISEVGPFSGEPEEWVCTISITSFDPKTNSYEDKDPEEMVEFLNRKEGRQ